MPVDRDEILGEVREIFHQYTNFLRVTWHALGLPEPTKRQYELAEFMQHGGNEIFVGAFRGIGKSFVAGAYGAFRLLHDPSDNIFTLSASAEKADELSLFARRLLNNPSLPFLHHLQPTAGCRDNISRWDVGPAPNQQMPSWKSIGVEGQIQGARSNLCILDDIETLANSKTPSARDNLLKQAADTESTKVPDDPSAQSIWLGTFQSHDSVYKELRDRGFNCRLWPSRYPSPDNMPAYLNCLAPSLVKELQENPELSSSGHGGRGAVTDTRFSEDFLISRERLLGRAQYQLQFQLDPHLHDLGSYPIRLEDLIVIDCNPEDAPVRLVPGRAREQRIDTLACVGHTGDYFYGPSSVDEAVAPYSAKVMAIDPSGSKGADETAHAIVAAGSGKAHLLDFGGRSDGTSVATMEWLAKAARRWRVNEILIESNFGGGTWTELFRATLKKIYPCTITEVRAKGKKEQRICDTLEPIIQAGKLVVDRRAIESEFRRATTQSGADRSRAKMLMHQLAYIKRQKGALEHDDRIDALEMACAHLRSHIGMDMEDLAKRSRDEEMDKALDSFLDTVLGRPARSNLWVEVP